MGMSVSILIKHELSNHGYDFFVKTDFFAKTVRILSYFLFSGYVHQLFNIYMHHSYNMNIVNKKI